MNIFLFEKRSSLNKHRVNLALARISTLHKNQGDKVFHFVLDSKFKTPDYVRPDKVYISIVFSWDVKYFIKFINTVKEVYKLESKDIVIGGGCTLYMKDKIIKETGIVPQTGCSKYLDGIIPDPELYKAFGDDSTYLFTLRACSNNCSFCIVPKLEPEAYIIPNWKEQINLSSKNIVICDNNLLAAPYEHRKAVFGYLSEIANIKGTRIPGTRKIRTVSFDGGFDFRHLTEENLELMKDIKFSKIKIAFDDIHYEKKFDEGMELLLKYFPKVSKRGLHENITCYVLYNCPHTGDTIEDTLYRIYKLKNHYKVIPYVMQYQPLDTLDFKSYVSHLWAETDCVDIGRWANDMTISMKVKRFKNYVGRKKDGKCLSETTATDREIMESALTHEDIPFDFSKGYNYNLPLLKQELEERKEINKKVQEKLNVEQINFLNMAG